MMMRNMHWNGDWHMGGMWLRWILIIVALVAVPWIAASFTGRGTGTPGESPEQALKRRYARGEIDRETYERTRADLRK